MMEYNKQQDRWLSSLKLKQYKEEENAAELIQHMIDIGEIIEQSEIEGAWWDAIREFEDKIPFRIYKSSAGIKVTRGK